MKPNTRAAAQLPGDLARPRRGTRGASIRALTLLALFSFAAALWLGGLSSPPAFATDSALVPAGEGADPRNGDLLFDLIEVQVWPEHDTPELLVLSDFILPPGEDLPVSFDLPLPKGAQVTALGEVNDEGEYLAATSPPSVDRSGDEGDVVRLSLKAFPRLRLEYYYDPGLDLEGTRRFSFEYELPGNAITVDLAIQRPSRSRDFTLDPPLSSTMDAEGFTYEAQRFSGVKGGDRFQVALEYVKDDAEPSVDPTTVAAASPQEEHDALVNNFLIVVGVVGVASLGMIGYGIRQKRRRPAALACAHCRAFCSGDDAFCTACGQPLE